MAGAVTARQKVQNFGQMLEARTSQLQSMLAKGVDVERFKRVALTAFGTTPQLQKCSVESVIGAINEAAALSLMPDSVLGEAYLVPYGQKCQLIPGYRGLMTLARRTGEVSSVEARVVRANDEFDVAYGLEPVLRHVPAMSNAGAMTHVYCVVRLKDGGIQWEIMTKDDVDRIRSRAKASGSGPWSTDYEAMALKTVIRKTLKMCPMSTEDSQLLRRAVVADEQREIGLEEVQLVPVEAIEGNDSE